MDAGNNILESTTTTNGGVATFSGVAADENYKLGFEVPTGSSLTLKDRGVDTQDSDPTPSNGISPIFDTDRGAALITDVDAGVLSPNSSIETFVWDDLNGNHRQDAGEPGIPNITVNLLAQNNTVLQTLTTDANGNVTFTGLSSNTRYRLQYEKPADYAFARSNQGNDSLDSDAQVSTGRTGLILIGSGTVAITDVDAGMWSPGELEAYVWQDDNIDGIQDANEPALSGILVELLESDFTVIASTTTDANGIAYFGSVPADRNVRVSFENPTGFDITLRNIGSDDELDSDPVRSNGRTTAFRAVRGAQFYTEWDAGMIPPSTTSIQPIPLVVSTIQEDTEESNISAELDIQELEKKQQVIDFNVYPNPVVEELNIELKSIEENSKLILLDPLGKLVWDTELEKDIEKYYLDVNQLNLTEGLYRIILISENYFGTKNIIIVR